MTSGDVGSVLPILLLLLLPLDRLLIFLVPLDRLLLLCIVMNRWKRLRCERVKKNKYREGSF
jgi:hypothetical protein